MGNKKGLFAVLAALFMLGPVLIPTSALAMNTGDNAANVSEPARNFSFTDKRVSVLTDEKMEAKYNERLSRSTSKVSEISALDEQGVLFSDIVMIDQSWLNTSTEDSYGPGISKLILRGIPVITVGSSPDVLSSVLNVSLLSHSFSSDADAYGYYLNTTTGETVSYSLAFDVDVSNKDEMAIGSAYNWGADRANGVAVREIDRAKLGEVVKSSNVTSSNESSTSSKLIFGNSAGGTDWGAAQWCNRENYYTQGYVLTHNAHFKLYDSSSSYNYWLSDFWCEVHPYWSNGYFDQRYATGDVVVRGDFDYYYFSVGWARDWQTIIRHGPGTTSGTSTASVSLGFNYNANTGATVAVNCGWSYSIPEVTVQDNSQTASSIGKFDWWHNVNEWGAVGHTTYFCEPGMITQVQQSKEYFILHENSAVTFCKRTGVYYSQFTEYTQGSTSFYANQ